MNNDQVVEELARTVTDLKKRLGAVARMYGKAQIELCSLRRRLGEGSDSELRKKTRVATKGPWISPEEALPKLGERVLAMYDQSAGPVFVALKYKAPTPGAFPDWPIWVDRDGRGQDTPAGWLPIPE